jgi:hypothetical protein
MLSSNCLGVILKSCSKPVSGQTRYTAVDGTPALKAAIISKFKRENALDYTATEVMVTNSKSGRRFNFLNARGELIRHNALNVLKLMGYDNQKSAQWVKNFN